MNRRNYQRELEHILDEGKGTRKSLLLHCCCAPCSSYVLEYLVSYFDITVFFYNPNITERTEYEKRKKELIRLIEEAPYGNPPAWVDADYEPERFFKLAEGLEEEPECGTRCTLCYELRLRKTAEAAKKRQMDYFCTTLSISPHKDADRLMEIGERLAQEYQIFYLPSDFKKKNGYKRSIELSREYHLYRQNYCGCIYSKRAGEREKRGECIG